MDVGDALTVEYDHIPVLDVVGLEASQACVTEKSIKAK
jgi:hypothetical protein